MCQVVEQNTVLFKKSGQFYYQAKVTTTKVDIEIEEHSNLRLRKPNDTKNLNNRRRSCSLKYH